MIPLLFRSEITRFSEHAAYTKLSSAFCMQSSICCVRHSCTTNKLLHTNSPYVLHARTQNTSTTKQHIFVKRKIGMADWIIPFWRPFLRLKTFNMSLHFRLKSAHGFRTRAERIAKVSFRGKFENVCTKLLSGFLSQEVVEATFVAVA